VIKVDDKVDNGMTSSRWPAEGVFKWSLPMM
jgi:hypothetical protein